MADVIPLRSSIVMMAGVVGLLACAGCFGSDTTRQEQRHVRDRATITGSVAGLPVEMQAEAQRIETAQTVERTDHDTPILDAVAEAAPAIVTAAGSGGGIGVFGPLAGALGISAAALAWRRSRQATGSLGRVVAGIEAAKTTLPPAAVDALHGTLSRKLDSADKARIRQLKATNA